MQSGAEMRRYDILDGEKIYMPSPTVRHQKIQRKLCMLMTTWYEAGIAGELLMAPIEILSDANRYVRDSRTSY